MISHNIDFNAIWHLVGPVGVEPTIDHVAALPIAYNPINVSVYVW